MDGITLAAIRSELELKITDSRIEKIQQPERDSLLIQFRGKQRLLLCVNPGAARIQLTKAEFENPMQAPMFCMLMRKILQGSTLLSIKQPGFDRMLEFEFSGRNELGDQTTLKLMVEIMGKYSNIILINDENKIIDSIIHVTPLMSSVRTVLPNICYQYPLSQGKRNPSEETKEGIASVLNGQEGLLSKLIYQKWSGISYSFAQEIVSTAIGKDLPWERLQKEGAEIIEKIFNFFQEILHRENFSPVLILDDMREVKNYFPFDPTSYSEMSKKYFDSMSQALDVFYSTRLSSYQTKQEANNLQRVLNNNIERCHKKQAIQQDILQQVDDIEKNRLYGELLTSNIYRLKKGQSVAIVENYNDVLQGAIQIPLDEKRSPNENAQRYYKRYNKMKAAYNMAKGQLQGIKKELDYLEGQLDDVYKCTRLSELLEIREELTDQGYIRFSNKKKRQNKKKIISEPMHFKSSTGRDILVGKNNAQNDRLTLKIAQNEEWWLHAQNIPGSHVLIRGVEESDEITLAEAAQLAAYYSKARQGAQVPVDYTRKKNIKKPSGASPGYVTYSTHKTLYVTPDEHKIKMLERIDKLF